jgi:hypothetical protein
MLLFLLACAPLDLRTTTFSCGKVICNADEICLHWDIADEAPPDAGHGCVAAPAACDGLPTCACSGEVCREECTEDEGVSCNGDEP